MARSVNRLRGNGDSRIVRNSANSPTSGSVDNKHISRSYLSSHEKPQIKAVIVSVHYGDLLAITLPRNLRHFTEITVVTTDSDNETHNVVARCPGVKLHITDAFYRHGAAFNKGMALEEGFDVAGREGWIAVVDADILFPEKGFRLNSGYPRLMPGNIYSASRRILPDPTKWSDDLDWETCNRHQEVELAGFLHLFHADDTHIRKRPWYDIAWKHAGGCDQSFQHRWPSSNKVRLPIDLLHLGEIDSNWYGRVTKRADGFEPVSDEEKMHRYRAVRHVMHRRAGVQIADDCPAIVQAEKIHDLLPKPAPG